MLRIFIRILKWLRRKKKSHIVSVLVLFAIPLSAQTIFPVKYENRADVKVFEVGFENQADLKVYRVDYLNQATNCDGLWFFTDFENRAALKVFFTNFENQADIKIFYVKYRNQAGWHNESKKQQFCKYNS